MVIIYAFSKGCLSNRRGWGRALLVRRQVKGLGCYFKERLGRALPVRIYKQEDWLVFECKQKVSLFRFTKEKQKKDKGENGGRVFVQSILCWLHGARDLHVPSPDCLCSCSCVVYTHAHIDQSLYLCAGSVGRYFCNELKNGMTAFYENGQCQDGLVVHGRSPSLFLHLYYSFASCRRLLVTSAFPMAFNSHLLPFPSHACSCHAFVAV